MAGNDEKSLDLGPTHEYALEKRTRTERYRWTCKCGKHGNWVGVQYMSQSPTARRDALEYRMRRLYWLWVQHAEDVDPETVIRVAGDF